MKLIHCSDIHLDSKMDSNLSTEKAYQRNIEICRSFIRMVDWAKGNGVDAVMVCGDLFDTDRASAATAGLIIDAVRNAGDIQFFYLRGNHDEAAKVFCGIELPENLKLFDSSWKYYSLSDDAVIAGIEPDDDCWGNIYDSLTLESGKFNIVMLHGQVGSSAGRELVCLPSLKNKGIGYLALGHLHSFQKQPLGYDGEWCYCGCLEGRGFDECGQKGFVLINYENGTAGTQFIPFASRELHDVPVDISGLDSLPEIIRAVQAASDGIDSRDLVKITLTGEYSLDAQKDLRRIQDSVNDRFWFVKVCDDSRLKISYEDYDHDISLKGTFVRMVLESSELSDADRERIIRFGINALYRKDVLE